jgi:hypothetical protein
LTQYGYAMNSFRLATWLEDVTLERFSEQLL